MYPQKILLTNEIDWLVNTPKRYSIKFLFLLLPSLLFFIILVFTFILKSSRWPHLWLKIISKLMLYLLVTLVLVKAIPFSSGCCVFYFGIYNIGGLTSFVHTAKNFFLVHKIVEII